MRPIDPEAERLAPLLGGSWDDASGDCRSAYRDHGRPGYAGHSVGFRVVCLPEGPSSISQPINPSTLAVA